MLRRQHVGPNTFFIGRYVFIGYARGDVHTNTAESSNALIKRGLVGIYHNVNREYLHRYLWQWDFCWNHRDLNDGERTVAAIKAAEGKRLMYKSPVAPEQPKDGGSVAILGGMNRLNRD